MKSNSAKRHNDHLWRDIYYDTDYLNLFLELKILKIDENGPINVLSYAKKINYFCNACITSKILTTNAYYICVWRSYLYLKKKKKYIYIYIFLNEKRKNN